MTTGINDTALDENRFAPLYLQVETTLKEMIEGTTYSFGDRIASERELSEMLGVSRMTVRRAIENLVTRGLLERRSTSGTYVKEPQVMRRVGKEFAQGLTQMLRTTGAQPGSRLLLFEIKPASLKISERLNIRLGESVVLLRRLRLANDVPFCIETSYIPYKLVPGLSAEDFALENTSLYSILRNRYKIEVSKNDETIKMSYATPEEAENLGINLNSPVILLRAVVSDDYNLPIEYLVSVNHPDRVVFHSMTEIKSW
ncbi:MAG: GntR family transcriptional regulator [Anaerolineae bacterium]|nr:GntR family transcriptional regulator [Anaerolineae bacterium]